MRPCKFPEMITLAFFVEENILGKFLSEICRLELVILAFLILEKITSYFTFGSKKILVNGIFNWPLILLYGFMWWRHDSRQLETEKGKLKTCLRWLQIIEYFYEIYLLGYIFTYIHIYQKCFRNQKFDFYGVRFSPGPKENVIW